MEILINNIMKIYLLDFDIEIEQLKENYLSSTPKKIIKLFKGITFNNNGLLSHKKNGHYSSKNRTEQEVNLNELYFCPKDLGLKKHSHKKFLIAYVSSAIYLSHLLSEKFKGDYIIVFNYFISNETSHDLRYYKFRENEEWVSLNFVNEPSSTGLLLLKK